MRANKRAFTLIELLVVIAIIAILAAILFPMFTKAKEKSKVSGCQNNLRQIYFGLIAYADDYNGKFPDKTLCGGLDQGGTRARLTDPPATNQLHSILFAYCGKKREVWRCPADTLVPRIIGGVFDVNDTRYKDGLCDFAIFGSSYQWRLGDRYPDSISGQTISFHPRPSQLSITRDAIPWHQNHKDASMKNWNELGSASNVMYLDGHIKLTQGTAFTGGI